MAVGVEGLQAAVSTSTVVPPHWPRVTSPSTYRAARCCPHNRKNYIVLLCKEYGQFM